jgi:malate dehydrogenase (oxaloacetate-decarboxylating)
MTAKSAGVRPPVRSEKEMSEQVARLHAAIFALPANLTRYTFLMSVLHYDEDLFFAAVRSDIPAILPLIYTPLVGDACRNYCKLRVPPRGLVIGIDKAGSVRTILEDWAAENNGTGVDVVVVTDAERILVRLAPVSLGPWRSNALCRCA